MSQFFSIHLTITGAKKYNCLLYQGLHHIEVHGSTVIIKGLANCNLYCSDWEQKSPKMMHWASLEMTFCHSAKSYNMKTCLVA